MEMAFEPEVAANLLEDITKNWPIWKFGTRSPEASWKTANANIFLKKDTATELH